MKHLLSVVIVLLALTCCTTEADRIRMRAGLDSINMRNRNDLPFTVSDVQPYVDFFDEHGIPNDRLLAHYLLGRAYHDHGEAPMALQCYQDAADCADTLSTDCDYPQLARVYGQMAQIFYEQGLYRQELLYIELSVKHFLKGKDTLAALICYEQKSQVYRNLNMPDSLLYICEHVSKLYHKYGYTHHAARALGYTLSTLIHRKKFDKVRRYMKIYESESGFFDSLGNIQRGREIYYRIKGQYFLHTNVLDSSDYYFRKELRDGKDFENQHSGALGLSELYQIRQQTDSTAKYNKYAYVMSDSLYAQRTAKEIQRIQAMYDYTRFQEISIKEEQRAERMKRILNTVGAFVLILALLAYVVFLRINRKKKEATLQYRNSLLLIEQAQYDIAKLQSEEENAQSIIAEKEKAIESLHVELLKHRQSKVASNHSRSEKELKESEEYKTFLKLSKKGQVPNEEEWQNLHIKLYELFPDFHLLLISKRHLLNKKEFNACFLLRLHFKPSDLMNMLDISSSYANKIRKSLLAKLFDSYGKAEEFDERISTIF